ncbi:MAG: SOS response-associated peptidase family protein [Pseudomonadota bacterium]
MCANYTPYELQGISEHYGVERGMFDFPPESYPGYFAPILRESHEVTGAIECVPAVFGMVPHWADMKLARQTYNARTETVAQKPSFRNAWKRKQFCIVPAHHFYEPNYESGKPVRWRIALADEQPMSIGGIWEWRPNGPDGQPLLSFSMLTINADEHPLMHRFHKPDEEKRMVVMLRPDQYGDWLEGALIGVEDVFQPYPADQLTASADPSPPRTKSAPRVADPAAQSS